METSFWDKLGSEAGMAVGGIQSIYDYIVD